MEDIIGSIAATLTTICFIPQVLTVVKTRQTKDISLAMYVTFTIGVAFWFTYGVLLMRWPVIIANVVTFCLSSVILYYKLTEK